MSILPDWLTAVIALVYPAIQAPPTDVFNGYVEADYAYAASALGGRITSISVEEGEKVFEGQQVFTLENTQQVTAVRAAEAQVRVAEANLDNLQTGSREQEIAVIRAQLAQAQAEQSLADTNLKRSEQLFQRGNAAVAQVDTDRTKLAAAVAQVTQLEAQLKVAELPARDAQRIAAEASLDAAKAQAQSAHSALDDRVVLAPATGIVDKVYFENGEVAGGGAPVMSILPDDSLRARFFLPESRRAEFMIGDTFVVSCNGCAEGITAMMTRISPSPQFTPPIIYSREERSRLVFQTDARIAKGSHLLPGQPITVSPAK